MKAPLLVELFTEELPPKSLRELGDAFASGIAAGLKQRGVLEHNDQYTAYATPRRLAVLVPFVLNKGLDAPIEEKLMPLAVARGPDGASPALKKKLSALGREHMAALFPDGHDGPDAFVIKKDGKAEFVYLKTLALGQPLQRALEEALNDAIDELPIPKMMAYQLPDGATVKFVRPAHGLVALHGKDEISVTALGLKASRMTHGHRFMGKAEIAITDAESYETTLEKDGMVIADFAKRRAMIDELLQAAAGKQQAALGEYQALLDEVTALVEHPSVYVGTFDAGFLEIPAECLILTMRQNQKYFPLFDAAGKLTSRFLIVSNMQVADPAHIISGNQRVIRPRLEDARFFYDQDRKARLETRVPQLAKVVYHNRLGTQLERVERVQLLAGNIARALKADEAAAKRAAWLAKADLTTGMVGEFPELQGIMGRYYALHDGEPAAVADAIAEHYLPRYAGDQLPESPVACAVALADKLETLAGLFGIDQLPTGDRDPFALRRHALGVIRILVERNLPLSLGMLIDDAFSVFPKELKLVDARIDLKTFFFDRMRGYFADTGYSAQEIDAVLTMPSDRIDLVPLRLEAVKAFKALPEAKDLAAANKRVLNIIAKNEDIRHKFVAPKRTLMTELAEIALMDGVEKLSPIAERHFKAGEYREALQLLANIKPAVDRFFSEVMVMVDDEKVRNNRAALLQQLGTLMNQVADISKLAT